MNRVSFVILTSFVLSAASLAQTQGSSVQLKASNSDFPLEGGGLVFPVIASNDSDDGSAVTGNFDQDWSGNNSSESWSTMSFSGFGSAQGRYGSLRTSVSGSLLGSFYNAENTPFHNSQTGVTDWNDGVPDVISMDAYAAWSDQLQVGSTAHNYYSTWIFNIHGNVVGDESFSYLRVRVGNNPADNFYYFYPGQVNEQIRVSQYIVGGAAEDVQFELYSVFQPSTQYFEDGADIYGSSDFGNTVTLEGIEFRDTPGGEILTGLSIESASGYEYSAVPEPATMAGLTLGVLALLRKRRKSA